MKKIKQSNIFQDHRPELAALLLLSVAVAAAVLYPETFISGNKQLLSSAGITPLAVLLPILAAGTLACFAFRWRDIKHGLLDVVVVAFLAYVVARNLTAPAGAASIKYFVFAVSPFFLGALLTRRGHPFDNAFLWIITSLTALTVIYGFIEYAAEENIIYYQYISETVLEPVKGLHRIGSTLAHPVSYAAFLVQALPFCVLAAALAKTTKMKVLAGIVSAAAAVALFLTYSKGSWLVAVAIAGSLVLLLWRRNRRLVLWLAVLAVAGLAVLTATFWHELNVETSARAESSVSTRLDAWNATASAIKDNWFAGVGLRQGKKEMLIKYDPRFLDYLFFAPSIDNNFLSVFLEEGIVGLALWLTVIALLIREGIHQIKTKGERSIWGMAMLASVIGFILNSITFDALLVFSNATLFWVAAGLLHGLSWRTVSKDGELD